MRSASFSIPATALVCCLGLLEGPSALANPVSTQILRLRQVPKTSHVQVTYGTMMKDLPGELRRDGTLLSATWTELTAFNANTGSGVTSIAAKQFCDCNVPLGAHAYELKTSVGGSFPKLDGSITVVADYELPAARDLGVGRDLMPWERPEPVELQGLDCVTECAKPKSDGPQAKIDGRAGVDAGTSKPVDKDSGCSLGGAESRLAPLFLGVALLLGGLLIRRRS